MGQYFTPTFLDSSGRIVAAFNPDDYGSGLKLFGHSRADTPLMWAVEAMLSLDGGMKVVWAGDYAAEEPCGTNLYFLAADPQFVRFAGLILDDVEPTTALPPRFITSDNSGYFCNADKREFIDKADLPVDDWAVRRSPLPNLTAEGGPGYVGRWARDRIFVSHQEPPADWRPAPSLVWT